MRKEYCCKKHATRIWHAKWSKSLKNEGFRELKWTCPLCSNVNVIFLLYSCKTEVLLSGIAYGGEKGAKGYKYTFYVDGIKVMEAFGESAYVWTPEAGNHKIKVVVEDNKGNKISSEKAYVIEAISNSDSKEDEDKTEDKDTVTNKPIITEKPTATPKITEKPIITQEPEAGRQALQVRMSASKHSPRKAGTYVVQGNVLDADGDIVSTTGKYTVSSPISVKSFKLTPLYNFF